MTRAPLLKICGVTRAVDASRAAALGADWIGLNFHPPSSRFLEPGRAAELIRAVGSPSIFVSVFVDRPVVEVIDVARVAGLGTVQLHGSEPDSDVSALREAGFRVIRAARVGSIDALDALLRDLRDSRARPDFLLLDAFVPGLPGGTGLAIASEILDSLPMRDGSVDLGDGIRLPLILAGGLNPSNVAERVARVRPWMVDVASGVESAPGLKDEAAMAAFVRAAKGA